MEEIKKQGMESLFCPYEQALSLKELGFDEPCFGCYDEKAVFGLTVMSIKQYYTNSKEDTWNCAAPLYQQAFRWFRKKYGLYFSIQYFQYDEWCLQITTKKEDTVFNYKSIDGFKTYEEAELACLQKLIEIVKNK
jgi:hypothetical protein